MLALQQMNHWCERKLTLAVVWAMPSPESSFTANALATHDVIVSGTTFSITAMPLELRCKVKHTFVQRHLYGELNNYSNFIIVMQKNDAWWT